MTDAHTRLAGLYAVVAAAAAVLLSPLLALSYFATSEGADELEVATVRAWAEPAHDLAGGLLTWAAPDRVYSTYVQLFALLFPAMFLCALLVRGRRPGCSRTERWGWRITLTGYGLAAVALLAVSVALVPADTDSGAVNVVFLALMLPGMLVSVVGSTVLGIGLLRASYRPRATAWLLALAFPSLAVISGVLGHTSLGMLPLMLAWAVSGLRLARDARVVRTAPAVGGLAP